jgi:capsular exopolysaccharide synthesis family protein
LHVLLNTKNAPGLSNILAAGLPVEAAIQQGGFVENLDFLPAGTIPPTPAELLTSSRYDALLDELRSRYDIILIDTPPVLHVADAMLVGNRSDTLLMVVRSGRTGRQMMLRAAESLQRHCDASLGLIVNGVDTSSADYYYAYGYYGAKEYYGTTENERND